MAKSPSVGQRELAGLRYIVRHLNIDGGVPAVKPGDASGGWTTAEAIEAIVTSTWPAIEFAEHLERMAKYLIDSQFGIKSSSAGGWPFVSGSTIASTMATAHATIALSLCSHLVSADTRCRAESAVRLARDWICNTQGADTGGWGVEPTAGRAGAMPRVVSTFLALRALKMVGFKPSSPHVQRGSNFLWTMRMGEGFRPFLEAPKADVCSTVRACTALIESGACTSTDKTITSAVAFLKKNKSKEGLWGLGSETYIPDGASGEIIFNHNSTSEILEFLASYGALRDAQFELVGWLSKHQRDDGSWFLGANDIQKHDILTWPTSESVLALSKFLRSTDIAHINTRDQRAGSNVNSAPTFQSDRQRADLAIVCALEGVELQAVKDLPWDWEPYVNNDPKDSNTYHQGYVRGARGKRLSVIAVGAPQMGMTAMAVLSMKVIERFRPRILATVGIAASVKPAPEINYGDILISDIGWDYGSGKLTVENDEVTLSPDPRQISLDPTIRNKFVQLKADATALATIKDNWRGPTPATSLAVHIGPVASGAAVVADTAILERIVDQQRKVIGLEMEIYSVFYAAMHCSQPKPVAVAIKSVCDYGDRMKSDKYQAYAAYTSARVLELFITKYAGI